MNNSFFQELLVFLQQLFTQLDTQDSMIILFFLTLCFLLGLWLGWLIRGRKVKRLKKELLAKDEVIKSKEQELEALKEQLDLRKADLKRADLEVREVREYVDRIEQQNKDVHIQLQSANSTIDQLQSKARTENALIEDLNHQILGLKAKNKQLADQEGYSSTIDQPELEVMKRALDTLKQEKEKLVKENNHLKNENERLRKQLLELEAKWLALQKEYNRKKNDNSDAERFRSMEEKLNQLDKVSSSIMDLKNQLIRLENENISLRSVAAKLQKLESESFNLKALEEKLKSIDTDHNELKQLEDRLTQLSLENQELKDAKGELKLLETKIEKLANENESLQQQVSNVKSDVHLLPNDSDFSADDELERAFLQPTSSDDIARFDPVLENEQEQTKSRSIESLGVQDPQDDLTLINGLGPFIKSQLNKIGITSFRQISEWDKPEIERITKEINFFEGRIEHDDWVGQAKALMKSTPNTSPKAMGAFIIRRDPADLKIIEGIGKKIEVLLKQEGINTWSDLAEATVERIKAILAKGGNAFNMHDPTNWPAQAQMAVDGEWDRLQEYQEYLIGGKDRKG